jgi:hypothetical protein
MVVKFVGQLLGKAHTVKPLVNKAAAELPDVLDSFGHVAQQVAQNSHIAFGETLGVFGNIASDVAAPSVQLAPHALEQLTRIHDLGIKGYAQLLTETTPPLNAIDTWGKSMVQRWP